MTAATRFLKERGVAFEPHLYAYKERGGTSRSASELGVPEHAVIKTLVMETETLEPLIVLMHGDFEVSTKTLARFVGVKRISPCEPSVAQRHTGHLVGGASPFGTRRNTPVYIERTIFGLEKIYINGGKRGFLVSMDPSHLRMLALVTEVEVAVQAG